MEQWGKNLSKEMDTDNNFILIAKQKIDITMYMVIVVLHKGKVLADMKTHGTNTILLKIPTYRDSRNGQRSRAGTREENYVTKP